MLFWSKLLTVDEWIWQAVRLYRLEEVRGADAQWRE